MTQALAKGPPPRDDSLVLNVPLPPTGRFRFVGGSLAIDFINTVGNRLGEAREKLTSAPEVERWARLAGLLSSRERLRIIPPQRRALIAAREELYALFRPVAAGLPVSSRSLAQLNRRLKQIAPLREITRDAGKFTWTWNSNGAANRLLAPILWDAAGLLVSGKFAKITQCADEDCGWLFLDRSQAGKRRWCSMADCGNRSKVRRFYLREQRSKSAARNHTRALVRR